MPLRAAIAVCACVQVCARVEARSTWWWLFPRHSVSCAALTSSLSLSPSLARSQLSTSAATGARPAAAAATGERLAAAAARLPQGTSAKHGAPTAKSCAATTCGASAAGRVAASTTETGRFRKSRVPAWAAAGPATAGPAATAKFAATSNPTAAPGATGADFPTPWAAAAKAATAAGAATAVRFGPTLTYLRSGLSPSFTFQKLIFLTESSARWRRLRRRRLRRWRLWRRRLRWRRLRRRWVVFLCALHVMSCFFALASL
jgi:hypothetical protein